MREDDGFDLWFRTKFGPMPTQGKQVMFILKIVKLLRLPWDYQAKRVKLANERADLLQESNLIMANEIFKLRARIKRLERADRILSRRC